MPDPPSPWMTDPSGPPPPGYVQLRMEIGGSIDRPRESSDMRSSSGPPTYGLRTFREGDQNAWVALLQSGGFAPWDRERLDAMLSGQRARVPLDGIFFATLDDRPVGTACTLLHDATDGNSPHSADSAPDSAQMTPACGPTKPAPNRVTLRPQPETETPERVTAELGWVVVAPDHRGHALGRAVCRAVLDYIGRLGYDRAYLLTDDWRLPAIQTYLTLGFAPALTHESHPARWHAIRAALSRPSQP